MPATTTTVAPRAGAWIETSSIDEDVAFDNVAPRAGAWIETAPHRRNPIGPRRRPPRGGVD